MDLTMCETIVDFRMIKRFCDSNLIPLLDVTIKRKLLNAFLSNYTEINTHILSKELAKYGVVKIEGIKIKVKEESEEECWYNAISNEGG